MAGAATEGSRGGVAANDAYAADAETWLWRWLLSQRRIKGHKVSGLSALLLLIGAGAVFWLARWAGQPTDDGLGHRTIQGVYGLVVAIVLGAAILTYAWAYRLSRSVATTTQTMSRIDHILRPLAWPFTQIDFFLVLVVADFCGGGPFDPGRRAGHFVLYFGASIAAAWMLPPPWGLLGVCAALLGILALNRKWAWVEEDRRNYVLSGHYDVRQDSPLCIGFDYDYRSVALTSLALMIVVMPLALMQMSAFGIFETADGSPIGDVPTLEWFVFFGGEMAKSVPFVDWSEVYGAETVTPIVVRQGWGQHVVFIVRVLVDLVLLAGFLQAFELSNRLARQKMNFHDRKNPQRILDPFQERDAFRDIARLAAPTSAAKLQIDLIDRMKAKLGRFAEYDVEQIQTILRWGEAPELWRPDHETAAAMIVPHKPNPGLAPQFFTQIIEHGVVQEVAGAQVRPRVASPRTQIAAIIAALGNSSAGYTRARALAFHKLPDFLHSEDDRVWSAAACALSEVRAWPDFPDDAQSAFERALEGRAAERHFKRTLLFHQALAYIADAEDDRQAQPHLEWSIKILADQILLQQDLDIRASAADVLGRIAFAPGLALDAARSALSTLVEQMRPVGARWRRFAPWLKTEHVRRRALASLAAI